MEHSGSTLLVFGWPRWLGRSGGWQGASGFFAVARGGDGGPAPVREMARWLRRARQPPVAFPCPVSAGWVPFSPRGLAFLTAASGDPCGRRWVVLDARAAALVAEARCSWAEAVAQVLPGGHGRVGGMVAGGMTIGGGGAASVPLPGAVSVDRGENLLCLWAV